MTKAKVKMGTASNDTLIGTNGVDFLYGLAGNDFLSGSKSADIIKGGDGDDTLEGGKGIDQLIGGAGDDTFAYKNLADITPSTSYYTGYSGDGAKVVQQYHFEEINDFDLGDQIDFTVIPGQSRQFIGENEFSGVAGEVRYSYNMMGGAKLEFDQNGDLNADAVIDISFDMMFSMTHSMGSSMAIGSKYTIVETETNSGIFVLGEDISGLVLTGDANANTLIGGEGDDTLSGLEGNDYLDGKTGSDQLDGGTGNDTLVSGLGSDYVVGGDGADTFIFNEPDVFSDYMFMGIQPFSSSISDFSKGDQIVIDMPSFSLTFVDSAEFSGVVGEYQFKDDSFSFDFDGDKNVDASISLRKSNSTPIILLKEISKNHFAFDKSVQFGSYANDTLTGTNIDDKIFGNDGNDSLVGGAGNDSLNGNSDNDTLIGGLGKDTLTGGSGKDIFVFETAEKSGDTITDFQIGSSYYGYESNDKIDLSAIDANSKTKGDQAFSFVGSANFTKLAGELHFVNGILEGDTNGDAKADFSIQLTGITALTAADFVL